MPIGTIIINSVINYLGVCHLAPYQLFQMAHQFQGIPLLSGSILQQLDSNTFQFPMETQIYKMTEVDPGGSTVQVMKVRTI